MDIGAQRICTFCWNAIPWAEYAAHMKDVHGYEVEDPLGEWQEDDREGQWDGKEEGQQKAKTET